MRIAITGVSSRLGAELVSRLERAADVVEILGFDRLEPLYGSRKLRFVKRDVRDPQIRGDLQGQDAIVHLAFIYQPPIPPLKEVYAINVDGSRNVFDCAIQAGVRKIVFASSVAAYGSFADNPVPISEEHPIRLMKPVFYYNACKVRVETCLDELEAKHPDLRVTRFRPCTIAGRGFSHVLSRRVFLSPFPHVPTQFVWMDDVVQAFHLALHQEAPGAFDIAGDHPLSFPEIAALGGRRCLAVPYPLALGFAEITHGLGLQRKLPPGWVRMSRYPVVVDCEKAGRVLGWSPQYDTRGAVTQFFSHERRSRLPGTGRDPTSR
jgi:UDP-glucose 4-epimerase